MIRPKRLDERKERAAQKRFLDDLVASCTHPVSEYNTRWECCGRCGKTRKAMVDRTYRSLGLDPPPGF